MLVVAACRPGAAPLPPEIEHSPRASPPPLVDPVFSAPGALDRAAASAFVLTLQAPVSDRSLYQTIDEFFRAVVKEDAEAIKRSATTDAVVLSRAHASVGLVDQWRTRFRSLNYEALKGQRLFRPSDVETYEYDDLDGISSGRPARPLEMAPGDRLVRVPMIVVRVAGDRVFGDEMVFLLRPVQRAYRVRAIVEDFQTP